MGDFDREIHSLREWESNLKAELEDLKSGDTWFRNGEDMSGALIARAEENLRRVQVYILAYESHNADRT